MIPIIDKIRRAGGRVLVLDGRVRIAASPETLSDQDRQRLTLTPEKRAERLTLARSIDRDWLGLPAAGSAIAQTGTVPIMKAEPAPVRGRDGLLTTTQT